MLACYNPQMSRGSRTFKTATEYLRELHPECGFVFRVVDVAVDHWGCTLAEACKLQSNMVTLACEDAKRRDAENGLQIIIEDETCSTVAAATL